MFFDIDSKKVICLPLTASLVAAIATGCSGSGGSAGGDRTGSLSIALMDAPVTDVTSIWLHIAGINVKPQGSGPAIEFPFDPPLEIDLLTLNADNTATLLNDEPMAAGSYTWIELEINADFNNPDDSYVTTVIGGEEELEMEVPSGTIRLVSGFTITADQATSFVIDWDARRGLVDPPGRPGYLLRPALRIIDMTEYGTLGGTIASEYLTDNANDCASDNPDLDVGNSVYIFAGTGATPDDIDSAAPPVATTLVEPDQSGIYGYSTILSPGDYTVAFTCQGGSDLTGTGADDDIAFSATADIVIEDGAAILVDFPITP